MGQSQAMSQNPQGVATGSDLINYTVFIVSLLVKQDPVARGRARNPGRPTYHRGMGEKQIRTQAEQVGAAALRPQFEALGDLAVAAAAAGQAGALRAAARARAQKILDDAEEEIVRRHDRWRAAWQKARTAGWSVERLRSAPISQKQPPAATKAKPAARASATTSGETTSGPESGPAGSAQPIEAEVPDPPLAHSA